MDRGSKEMRLPSVAEAVAASVAVGRRLGLPTDHPVVVAEGYSTRVRLGPAVTRVFTAGQVLRGPGLPWMRREVDVVSWLTARGAPVVPCWSPAGPFSVDGLTVSLSTWVEPVGDVGPADFGRLLGTLHEALADCPLDLPLLVGPLTDVTSALTLSDDPALHVAAARILPLTKTWPRRPLHGDAHRGNVLVTADGPRFMDFEDVCVGPLEWDLASTSLTDDSVDAYPEPVDRVRLEECRALRRLQVLAGVLTDDVQDPSLYEGLVAALQPFV